jgi:hypothetical protein
MPNLIVLAIPGFIVLVAIEAVADTIMRRDLYEIKIRLPASRWD